MFPISKYKFYTTPDNKTIAISTYAGKTVRGVAKVDPRDEFDAEFGKKLAAARCNAKIAKKRRTRAMKQVRKAADAFNAAYDKFQKMKKYENDAFAEYEDAIKNVTDLEAKG